MIALRITCKIYPMKRLCFQTSSISPSPNVLCLVLAAVGSTTGFVGTVPTGPVGTVPAGPVGSVPPLRVGTLPAMHVGTVPTKLVGIAPRRRAAPCAVRGAGWHARIFKYVLGSLGNKKLQQAC